MRGAAEAGAAGVLALLVIGWAVSSRRAKSRLVDRARAQKRREREEGREEEKEQEDEGKEGWDGGRGAFTTPRRQKSGGGAAARDAGSTRGSRVSASGGAEGSRSADGGVRRYSRRISRRSSESSRRPSGMSAPLWRNVLRLQAEATTKGSATVSGEEIDELVDFCIELRHSTRDRHKALLRLLYDKVSTAPDLFDETFTKFIENEFVVAGGGNRSASGSGGSRPFRGNRKGSVIRRMHSAEEVFADPRVGSPSTNANRMDTLISNIRQWNFDIFALADSTSYPLVVVGQTVLAELGLIDGLAIDSYKLRTFLLELQSAYYDNPYHNALHACDVTQTIFYLMKACGIADMISPEQQLGAIVAASIHDVSHPGVNSKFLINTWDDLAITYNDSSPLENMHLSFAFRLLRKPGSNFLQEAMPDDKIFREFRRLLVDMVLATDNDKHFVLMKRLEDYLGPEMDLELENELPEEVMPLDKDTTLLLQTTLHAADVSNPAKQWDIYTKWTDRIMQEFFTQGDKERELGLPISFAFDRSNPVPRPKFQLGFIVAIVEPLYRTLNRFDGVNLGVPLEQLMQNQQRFKALQDQGVNDEPVAALEPPRNPALASVSSVSFSLLKAESSSVLVAASPSLHTGGAQQYSVTMGSSSRSPSPAGDRVSPASSTSVSPAVPVSPAAAAAVGPDAGAGAEEPNAAAAAGGGTPQPVQRALTQRVQSTDDEDEETDARAGT